MPTYHKDVFCFKNEINYKKEASFFKKKFDAFQRWRLHEQYITIDFIVIYHNEFHF